MSTHQEASQAVQSAPAGKAGALITAIGVGQVCSWGSLYYSFPVIAEAMGADLGWSKTDLYGAATVGLALAALAAYPVGVAVDRGYGRFVMGFSSLMAAVLLVLWSRVDSLTGFYVFTAGIGALQAATLYEPAFAVIARRVGPAGARSGITAVTLWGGFASTVFIPFVQLLLNHGSWRQALLVLALINATICAGAYLGFVNPKRDAVSHTRSDAHAQAAKNRQAVRAALHRPVFWALFVALAAYAAMFSAFTFHMYAMLRERGIQTSAVVNAIACIGPAQVAGRIVISIFAAKASTRMIGVFVVVIFPLAFGALTLLPPNFMVAAGVCIVYGGANGIFTIVRGLVVPEMLSRHAYGAINGLLTIPVTFARAAAPLGAAFLWGLTASYSMVLAAIVLFAAILTLGFWAAAWFSRLPQPFPTHVESL